ncbi:helix-turn-helix domain-containing protein [Alteromonas antoniana]|uniref:helix-turn-helix domain-containing protein n=1 Tax=Alteromonas antoniana TaxID=2803813 RepID=UPI001C489F7A
MLVNIDAEKIKQLRESRCWSQQQLADLSALSLRTVQRIEAKSVASQESVKCLAATFDVPAHTLLKSSAPDASTDSKHYDNTSAEDTSAAPATQTVFDTPSSPVSGSAPARALRKLYIRFAIVFASHLFGFYGIFTAFDEGRISEDTFQMLKNSLSIVLIVSAGIFFFKDRTLKKQHASGSSL